MALELSRTTLEKLLEAQDVSEIDFSELERLVSNQQGISQFKPDGVSQIDPRNGDRILYNTARAKRPHDNRPAETGAVGGGSCVICDGKTTGVVDCRTLSSGFTFINKNLFPMLFPEGAAGSVADPLAGVLSSRGQAAVGLHLLQWTSSLHDADFHNMPVADLTVVVERLAALEKRLLTGGSPAFAGNAGWGDRPGYSGFVSIIKNYGRLVGGSLAHGHQQIAFSNVIPRKFLDNLNFERQRGRKFTEYLLAESPKELVVRDYGNAALVVPYFMKRPFEMFLVMKETSKRYLHELDGDEQMSVAAGWHDAIKVILDLMPRIGREPAYNVVAHTGPGAGIYFEFLPYTQETGGYEHLGLYICQGNPAGSALELRKMMQTGSAGSETVTAKAACC